MNLWTWQTKGFNIDDPNIIINSREHSYYWNEPDKDREELERFRKAYERLWKTLETEQILWCYTDKIKAENAEGNDWCKNCVLFEMDVPEKSAKFYCDVAWYWILNGTKGNKCYPPQGVKPKFFREFHNYWQTKSEEELWDKLFLPHFVKDKDCVGAIIFPPVPNHTSKRIR